MPRFSGKNIFITITNILCGFNTEHGDKLICDLLGDDQLEQPRWVWEKSPESNEHVHIVFTLKKSMQFTRKKFQPLLDYFKTKALNIQTWSRKATYKHALTGKSHRGKPHLWLFEKFYYCDCKPHEDYFDKEKFARKSPTVVRVGNAPKNALYNSLRKSFDAWLAEKTEEKVDNPEDYFMKKTLSGFTQDDLDDFIVDPQSPFKMIKHAVKNYKAIVEHIETVTMIQDRRRLRATYAEKAEGYRPFQSRLTEILDTQNDRNIHQHVDDGGTGKNMWAATEALRDDTLVVQSAKTENIAYAWNPKKHKRIIVDVPRGKMQYLNTSAIEKLKNGSIFSTKYTPVTKHSEFKPSIIILGNEYKAQKTWTEDRLTTSTTSEGNQFAFESVSKDQLARIIKMQNEPDDGVIRFHCPDDQ